MKNRWALLVACAALSGCSDDPTSPTASSSLGFSYTGAGATASTSFSASGTIPTGVGNTSNNLGTSAWAAGGVSATTNYTTVVGVIPRSSTTWDLTEISIARKTVGTSNVDAECDDEAENCTGVFMFFNFNPNGDTFTYFCSLTTGTVTISAISATNITGSFSGTGQCFTPAFVSSSFTVTNGTFNVAVTTQLLN